MENRTTLAFEEKMSAISLMSEAEITNMIDDIKAICRNFCGECPSYTATDETELAFCARGTAEKVCEELGCMCGACPVSDRLSLRWNYYCMKGSGEKQAGIS